MPRGTTPYAVASNWDTQHYAVAVGAELNGIRSGPCLLSKPSNGAVSRMAAVLSRGEQTLHSGRRARCDWEPLCDTIELKK